MQTTEHRTPARAFRNEFVEQGLRVLHGRLLSRVRAEAAAGQLSLVMFEWLHLFCCRAGFIRPWFFTGAPVG
jgi:hypothetical protein